MPKKRTKQPKKQKIVGLAAISIDGYIALDNTKIPDWTSKEDWVFFQKYLADCDAVVVGRRTFIAAATQLRKRTTFVLSNNPKETITGATIIAPKVAQICRALSPYKKVAILGGRGVYSFFLSKRLISELYVTIEPLLFGRGTALVELTKTIRCTLASVTQLNKRGTLLLRYTMK
jgi:dihydrofolate reductase